MSVSSSARATAPPVWTYEPALHQALRLRASVAKDLRRLPRADVERILARIQGLRDDPRPPGAEKLSAQ